MRLSRLTIVMVMKVGFAQWDASKTDHPPALLAKLFAPEKLPAVLLFSPGEHSKGKLKLF
jgi:hypothetical protein